MKCVEQPMSHRPEKLMTQHNKAGAIAKLITQHSNALGLGPAALGL